MHGFRLHNEYFPELQPFMVDALKELKDVLIHAVGGLGSTLHVNVYLVFNIMNARFLDVTMDYVSVQFR
jgi:enamine deaminase RidA (YjgF/YER057c/UK114 family)